MSNQSERDKAVKGYLLECITNEGYSDQELKTDTEKLQFFYDTFKAEYGFNIDRMGELSALIEYFSGLPSCCSIAFNYVDIIYLLKKWEILTDHSTDRQIDNACNDWFKHLGNKMWQLIRKHKVNKGD